MYQNVYYNIQLYAHVLASFPGRLLLRSLDRICDLLNRPEKWEKAWYIFYVIKPQGGLDHEICGVCFSNYGNVPTHVIASSCG